MGLTQDMKQHCGLSRLGAPGYHINIVRLAFQSSGFLLLVDLLRQFMNHASQLKDRFVGEVRIGTFQLSQS